MDPVVSWFGLLNNLRSLQFICGVRVLYALVVSWHSFVAAREASYPDLRAFVRMHTFTHAHPPTHTHAHPFRTDADTDIDTRTHARAGNYLLIYLSTHLPICLPSYLSCLVVGLFCLILSGPILSYIFLISCFSLSFRIASYSILSYLFLFV